MLDYIRKQVLALEAKPAPSLREVVKVAETKVQKKRENNATNSKEVDDEACPLDCKIKHHLAAPVLSSRI